jgi:DNA-binding GntR family transcriptional regulator
MFATSRTASCARISTNIPRNIEFHQTIIRMSGNGVLIDLPRTVHPHAHDPRKTIGEKDRADARSATT